MKAGIYKLFDGGLIYVRKDRTVSAAAGTNYPIQIGAKVSTLEGGKYVLAETGDKQFQGDRHADVPNGCTDHQALVDSMHMAANLEPGQRVVDYGTKLARVEPAADDEFDRIKAEADDPYKRMAGAMRHVGAAAEGAAEATRRFFTVPPELSAPYTDAEMVAWREKFAASLVSQGFKLCHKGSARKHRRQGHTVLPIGDGRFAWRAVTDDLYPYQRKTLAQLERYLGVVEVASGAGKAGAP